MPGIRKTGTVGRRFEWRTYRRVPQDGTGLRITGLLVPNGMSGKIEGSVTLISFAARMPTSCRRNSGGGAGRRRGPSPMGGDRLGRYHLGQSHHGKPGSRPNPYGFRQESKGSVQGPWGLPQGP